MSRIIKTFEQFDNSLANVSNAELKQMHESGMISDTVYFDIVIKEDRFNKTNTALVRIQIVDNTNTHSRIITVNFNNNKIILIYDFTNRKQYKMTTDKESKTKMLEIPVDQKYIQVSDWIGNTITELGADFYFDMKTYIFFYKTGVPIHVVTREEMFKYKHRLS